MKLSEEMNLRQIFSANPDDLGVYYPSVDGHLVMEWRSKVVQLEAVKEAAVDLLDALENNPPYVPEGIDLLKKALGGEVMTEFEIIEHGLCCKCHEEVYALSYGQETITPKKHPDDWRARKKAQTNAFKEMAAQRKTRVVLISTCSYDGGETDETLCERHLRLALDALTETEVSDGRTE